MKTNKIIDVSPIPNSVLLPGDEIVITYERALKDTFGVSLGRKTKATVNLTNRNKSVTISKLASQDGCVVIELNGMSTKDNKYRSQSLGLSYALGESDYKKKKSESIIHMKNLSFNLQDLRGQALKVETKAGSRKDVFIDEKGKMTELDKVMKIEAGLHKKKYGKLHPTLYEVLKKKKSEDTLEIEIWLNDKRRDVDKSKLNLEQLEKMHEKNLKTLSGLYKASSKELKTLAKKHNFTVVRQRKMIPTAVIKVKKKDLDALMKSNVVSQLFYYDPRIIEDLDNAMSVSNADTVQSAYGLTGSKINVAVYESGPDNVSNLNILDYYDSAQSSQSGHATNVTGIIQNTQANGNNGFAPGCNMYSANNSDIAAVEWAVLNKRCSVINQSFHTWAEPHSADLSLEDKIKDYLAYYYPYPTIVHAAGNFWSTDPDNVNPPESEYVNHKGFNTISVGNHSDDGSSMSSSSVFRNPTSPHSDRELPEISANGIGYNIYGTGAGSGTSYSSPAVAGSCALLQEENNTLKYWPEGVRALLFAGASRNVDGGNWWQDVVASNDAKDGAGALNALESLKITRNRKSRNNAASSRGWDVGRLQTSDFNASGYSNFSYKLRVPSTWGIGRTRKVKVALAWSNKVTKFLWWYFENNIEVDFDLKVYNSSGVLVSSSNSWDNSYEIAEFRGVVGETYTIKIRRWSGTQSTYYGLAWTTGNLFNIFKMPRFRLI